MSTLLIILIIITTTLLILVTSLQSSKKEGLGNSLGSMGAHQIIGVKKTSDLLEQVTWGLLIGLFILSLGTSYFLKKRNTNLFVSPNLERIHVLAEPVTEGTLEPDAANTNTAAK
jgi:preprotein translocase subunit SecG